MLQSTDSNRNQKRPEGLLPLPLKSLKGLCDPFKETWAQGRGRDAHDLRHNDETLCIDQAEVSKQLNIRPPAWYVTPRSPVIPGSLSTGPAFLCSAVLELGAAVADDEVSLDEQSSASSILAAPSLDRSTP